ncbi:MAG: DUF3899 domain-containing protein [bacterium]
MIKKLKKIKPAPLITHLIITLAYPVVKTFTAEGNRLIIFANAITIIGFILIIGGIIYSMNLHGDFDATRYYMQSGVRSFRSLKFFNRGQNQEIKQEQNPAEFLQELKEKRADAFNYPLFLGIIYVLISIVIVYGFRP